MDGRLAQASLPVREVFFALPQLSALFPSALSLHTMHLPSAPKLRASRLKSMIDAPSDYFDLAVERAKDELKRQELMGEVAAPRPKGHGKGLPPGMGMQVVDENGVATGEQVDPEDVNFLPFSMQGQHIHLELGPNALVPLIWEKAQELTLELMDHYKLHEAVLSQKATGAVIEYFSHVVEQSITQKMVTGHNVKALKRRHNEGKVGGGFGSSSSSKKKL